MRVRVLHITALLLLVLLAPLELFAVDTSPVKPLRFLPSRSQQPMSDQSLIRFRELSRLAGLDIVFLAPQKGFRPSFQAAALAPGLTRIIFMSTDRLVSSEHDNRVIRLKDGLFTSLELGPGLSTQRASFGFIGFSEPEVAALLAHYRKQYATELSTSTRLPAAETLGGNLSSPASSASFPSNLETLERAFMECGKAAGIGAFEGLFGPSDRAMRSAIFAIRNLDQWLANSKRDMIAIRDAITDLAQRLRQDGFNVLAEQWEKRKYVTSSDIRQLGCTQVAALLTGTVPRLVEIGIAKGIANTLAPEVAMVGSIPTKSVDILKARDWPPAQQALAELKSYLENAGRGLGHSLEIKNGRGILHVDEKSLQRSQMTFMKLAQSALKAGAIAELQTGSVTGPKVLAFLNRVRDIQTKTGERIKITGHLDVKELQETMQKQVANSSKHPPGHADHWSSNEVADYQRAINDLGLKKACLDIYHSSALSGCGVLMFEFDNLGTSPVRWTQGTRVD